MANYHPTSVRLIPRLRQLLRQEAKREGRSVQKQIVQIIRAHYEAQGVTIDKPTKGETDGKE